MKKNFALVKVIKKVGSMKALSDKLGVSASYISHLAKGRKKIPIKYLSKLVKLSDGEVTREELRPDVYVYED